MNDLLEAPIYQIKSRVTYERELNVALAQARAVGNQDLVRRIELKLEALWDKNREDSE